MRLTSLLCRVPVIKFRKGKGPSGAAPAAAPMGSCPAMAPAAARPPGQVQPAAAMSSGAISDIDLPPKYRRQPLSDEEIDHINGGGVDEPAKTVAKQPDFCVKMPCSMVIQYAKKNNVLSLNIRLRKSGK